MKLKYFLLLILLAGYLGTVNAQVNATEAKAAYLLAEESYGKGDYKAALEFISQVKTNLGSANCKVLYLEIMVAKEYYTKDLTGMEKLLDLINQFEKSSDYNTFNEEKVLEVSKLKIGLRTELKSAKDKIENENAKKAAIEKAFNAEFNRLGPWNVGQTQLDSLRPDLKLSEWKLIAKTSTYSAPGFIYHVKPEKRYSNLLWEIADGIEYKNKVANVTFWKDRVYRYQTFLVYNKAETGNNAWDEAQQIIKEYTTKLGFEPVKVENGANILYTWTRDKQSISLQLIWDIGKKAAFGPLQLIESLNQN